MCIMCAIGKAIEHEENKNTLHVGVVSEQLRADFKAHETAEALADLEVEQLVLNARRAFLLGEIDEAEVEKRQEEVNAKQEADAEKYGAAHEALWNRVYEELDIKDRKRGYNIDATNGEVTTRRRRGETGAFPNGR